MKRYADKNTSLQELKDLVIGFGEDRNWRKHHTPKNLAMSIAVEAAELMEHYLWERKGDPDRQEIADELSDIIFNCLNFAVVADIDVAEAFERKYQKMNQKYPTKIFNKHNDSLKDYERIKKAYRKKNGKI